MINKSDFEVRLRGDENPDHFVVTVGGEEVIGCLRDLDRLGKTGRGYNDYLGVNGQQVWERLHRDIPDLWVFERERQSPPTAAADGVSTPPETAEPQTLGGTPCSASVISEGREGMSVMVRVPPELQSKIREGMAQRAAQNGATLILDESDVPEHLKDSVRFVDMK